MKSNHLNGQYFVCTALALLKKVLFVLFILLSATLSRSQAQNFVDAGRNKIIRFPTYAQLQARPAINGVWKEHRKTTTSTFMDACFVTDTTMIVAGTKGNIMKFSNEKWHTIPVNTTSTINAIDFYDDKNGLAVGTDDLILKTTDGGNTWTQIASATGYLFYSLQYVNSQTIYLSGYKLESGAPVKSAFFKSTDGGNNWNLISEIPGYRITSFDFINSSLGIACGNRSGIFKTTDGGNSWQQLTVDLTRNNVSFDQIKAASIDTIYAVGNQGKIIKSFDGGNNWIEINPIRISLPSFNDTLIDTTPAMYKSIVCFSSDRITVAGNLEPSRMSWVMTSYDGGNSWEEEKTITGSKTRILRIVGNGSGGLIVTGEDGIILTKSSEDKFEWSPARGLSATNIPDPMAAPDVTTTYTVKRTSGSYTATDSVTVYVAGFSDKFKTINCGNTVQLDSVIYPSNFKGAVHYKWTPSIGLDNDTIAQPVCSATEDTKYTCVVVLNDGKSYNNTMYTDSVFVFVNTFEANAGDDIKTVCGSNVTLSATHNYTGPGNVTYKWYPSMGLDDNTKQNPVASISGDITYTVAVTTSSGCVAYDDVTIKSSILQPLIISQRFELTCGNTIIFDSIKTNYQGSGRLSYKWTPATGLNNDTVASPVCSASTYTSYVVTITTLEGNSTSSYISVWVNPVAIKPLNNKSFYCGQQVQLDSVTTNYTGTEKLSYKWTPATGLSNDTIPNPVATPNETTIYTVTISTPQGCTSTSNVTLTKQAAPTPAITGVSVDNQFKNKIVWEIPAYEYDSIFIYKETNQLNQYIKIGSVGSNINSLSDTLSQPKVMSNAYKISLLDRCGIETALSNKHKTMHLAINKGINNSWNLIWEPYVGFEVATYYIYRGTAENQLSLISSLSGANTQFSDFTAPGGDIYYQIEAVKSGGASGIKDTNGEVRNQTFTSRSNIAAYHANVGLNNLIDISSKIELLPNPAHHYLEVQTRAFNGTSLILTIYSLQGVALKKAEILSSKQQIDITGLNPGMYMVVLEDSQTRGSKKLVVK